MNWTPDIIELHRAKWLMTGDGKVAYGHGYKRYDVFDIYDGEYKKVVLDMSAIELCNWLNQRKAEPLERD